jgi:hypothetical protein
MQPAGEAGILLHIFGKFMILKLKSSSQGYRIQTGVYPKNCRYNPGN